MNVFLSLSVRVWFVMQWARRQLGKVALAATVGLLTPLAQADDDVAGMINKVTDGADSTRPGLLKAFIVVGIVLVAGGVIGLARSKKDPQIKASHCWLAIAFGAILIALDQLIKKSQTQMDMSAVDVG